MTLVSMRIQVAGLRQRAAGDEPGDVQAVQTQQVVEPPLYRVPRGVTDGLVQGDLVERASCVGKKNGITHGFDCWVRLSECE